MVKVGFLLRVFLCVLIMGFLAVFESMVLFPCSDPRYPSRPLPIGGIPPVRSLKPLQQDNTNLIEEGHYMLYLYGNASFVT
jgi:hypothetical protein